MFWDDEAARLGGVPEGETTADEFDPTAFGRRLKEARNHAGLPQSQAAQRLGVSQATYSRMEDGRTQASRARDR